MADVGLAIVVDAEFRKTGKCDLCEDPIGDEDFVVLCWPGRAEWENGHDYPPTKVSKCLEVEHVRCRNLLGQAVDASFGY